MATTINIGTLVNSMLGVTVTTGDDTLLAGMEDIVNKVASSNPAGLGEFIQAETTISSIPVTLQQPALPVDVYKDGQACLLVKDTDHIKRTLSLWNDLGMTAYYYIIGNKMYIEPFRAGESVYTYRAVSYAATSGVVTFPSTYYYPLALFCAYNKAFTEAYTAITAIATDIASIDTVGLVAGDYALVTARLAADDVELANGELMKLKTMIDNYSAETNAQAIAMQRIQSRTQYAMVMLNRYSVLKAQYNEYFGLQQVEKQ